MERFLRCLKESFRAVTAGEKSWEEKAPKILLSDRSNLHPQTSASMLFGRIVFKRGLMKILMGIRSVLRHVMIKGIT